MNTNIGTDNLSSNEKELLRRIVDSSFTHFRYMTVIGGQLIIMQNGMPLPLDNINQSYLYQSIQQLIRRGYLMQDHQDSNVFHLTEQGLEYDNATRQ